eukprot:TCONS_00035924-protein
MNGTVEFGKVCPNILMKEMIQYRMYRHSNVPSLVRNDLRNSKKPKSQAFFSVKKHAVNRYHPYLNDLKKHRKNKNKFQKPSSLDIKLESKITGYQPNHDPKHFLEFLDKIDDSQDSVYKKLSPDIDRLSFAFGEMLVFDEFKCSHRKVASGEKEVASGKKEVTSGKKEVTSGKKEVTGGEKEVTRGEQSNAPTAKIYERELSSTKETLVPRVKIYETELAVYTDFSNDIASSASDNKIPQDICDMVSTLRQEATENQKKRKLEEEVRNKGTNKSKMINEKIQYERKMTERKTFGRKMKIVKKKTGRQGERAEQKTANSRGVNEKYNGKEKCVEQSNNRDRTMNVPYNGRRKWFGNRQMDDGKYSNGVKRQQNYGVMISLLHQCHS